MKVILDTNFLIYCAKNKKDYLEEIGNLLNEDFQLIVPKQVLGELEIVSKKTKSKIPPDRRDSRFMKTTGRDKAAALLALQIINKYIDEGKVKKIELEGRDVDKAILKLANENIKNIVASMDRDIRGKIDRVILVKKNGKLMITR